jgi:predicted negative regulator of RcsB-dependent stress response
MTRTGAEGRPALEDHAESFADWLRVHTREVTIGVVLLAAIAGGGWLYARSRTIKADRAEAALAAAQQSVATGNIPLAQSDLQKLTVRYDGTIAADRANMLLAQLLFDAGKVDSGLAVLTRIDDDGPLGAAAASLRGAGLEQKKQYAEAARAYLDAAASAGTPAERDGFRADAARAYTQAGNTSEALKIWRELAADDRSIMAAEARVRIGELTAKPAD